MKDGNVEAPTQIVGLRDTVWPVLEDTSPFAGILDLYRLNRFPLSDSATVPGNVVLYEVDAHIPGAALARPDATIVAS